MKEVALAILGSSAFTLVVNAIIDAIKEKKGKKKHEREAVKLALLFCLQSYGEKLLRKDSIEEIDVRQFDDMYKEYKALDGDGYADKIKQEVDKLPIKRK